MNSNSSQTTNFTLTFGGMYPFWFWNGDLSEREIRWQINEMAEKGIKGFFIHPRQGMIQPYLSETFFDMVRIAVTVAEDHGLVVHLNDEFPYPSGVAGGEVLLGNPEFLATRLIQKAFDTEGGHVRKTLPQGKILSCMAYPLHEGKVNWTQGIDLRKYVGMVLADNSYYESGLTQYNQKRYFASNPVPMLDTTMLHTPHRIFVSVQAVVEDHKYWRYFVDVLNPQAIQQFIQLTHERYRNYFADKFGKSIYSFFVDETCPSWSSQLPMAFECEYGYDLLSLLPALQDTTHPSHSRVTFDINRIKYKLFCKSFEEPIRDWCARYNLRYSGEKPSQRLSQLQYMDIPGCEPGHTKAGVPMDLLQPKLRGNARATASAAYFYGKEGALCESFHSLGWSATLQDIKVLSEGLLLMGISYLVPHGFFYTTHSLTKHDAPPSFFFQMPYWPFFGYLAKRLQKIGTYFENTYIDADILIVDPNSGLPAPSDERIYERIMHILMENHLDFLMVDTDILNAGRIQDGKVHIRDISADVVILPPMQFIEQPLQAWLQSFEDGGGKVVRCDDPSACEHLLCEILETVKPRLPMRVLKGDTKKLQVVTRTNGKRTFWFVLNVSDEKLEVEFLPECTLREIPLDENLPAMLTRSEAGYVRTIHPFESLLLEGGGPLALAALPGILTISISPSVKVTIFNNNLLQMRDWQMELLDENGKVMQTETVPAIPLANQLARGRFRFTPETVMSFGCMPELHQPTMNVRYHFEFESNFPGAVELVIEPGSIVGNWTIRINDSGEIHAGMFSQTNTHVRGSLGLDVTQYLEIGQNRLIVNCRTNQQDGGLLNPLYLAGNFGVEFHPLRLVERPASGGFETWEKNALPYYAGVAEYESTFNIGKCPDTDHVLLELNYPIPFQDACEVSINGGDWHPVLWSPNHLLLSSSKLHEDGNVLRMRVYTSLIRSFEGQMFDYQRKCYRDVNMQKME